MSTALFLTSIIMFAGVGAVNVPHTPVAPIIDGNPSDSAWDKGHWQNIDQRILGPTPAPEDFSGRYKLLWTSEYLYLLAEITDNLLVDSHSDPTDHYWDDDMLEIFIDEDASGGEHLENFNAFAYHISLDNQVVDIAPLNSVVAPRLFPNHIQAVWSRQNTAPYPIFWEVRIAIHNDQHQYGNDESSRVSLSAEKVMGFMVAYGDADDASGRRHFVGDVNIEPVNGDRNRGYIDASVFGKIILSK